MKQIAFSLIFVFHVIVIHAQVPVIRTIYKHESSAVFSINSDTFTLTAGYFPLTSGSRQDIQDSILNISFERIDYDENGNPAILKKSIDLLSPAFSKEGALKASGYNYLEIGYKLEYHLKTVVRIKIHTSRDSLTLKLYYPDHDYFDFLVDFIFSNYFFGVSHLIPERLKLLNKE